MKNVKNLKIAYIGGGSKAWARTLMNDLAKEEETAQVLQQAVPEDLQQVAKNWDRICGSLSGSVRALLKEAIPSVGEGNSLLLVFHNDIHYGLFDSEEHITELKDAIERQIQKEIQIKLQLVNPNETKREDLPDLSKLSKMTIEFED